EGVVEQDRGPVVAGDDRRAGQAAEDAELLSGAGAQLVEGQGDAVQGAGGDPEVRGELHLEGGTEHDAPEALDGLPEGRQVAGVGLGPAALEGLVEGEGGGGPGLVPVVLELEVLPSGDGPVPALGQALLPLGL